MKRGRLRDKERRLKLKKRKNRSDKLKNSINVSQNIVNGSLSLNKGSLNELQSVINKSKDNSVVKSFTVLSTMDEITQYTKGMMTNDNSSESSKTKGTIGWKCSIWNKELLKDSCILNTSWRHIYHQTCLIAHCRDYLAKWQYPRNCPKKGCKRILGPQEITKHLNGEEYIKFEAFSMQRSGQKSRKQLYWCSHWHLIFANSYDENNDGWIECKMDPTKFQDVLKFFDTNSKIPEDERENSKILLKNFLQDCKGVVERCNICLKRRQKIHGYKYEIWICEKVTKSVANPTKEADLNLQSDWNEQSEDMSKRNINKGKFY